MYKISQEPNYKEQSYEQIGQTMNTFVDHYKSYSNKPGASSLNKEQLKGLITELKSEDIIDTHALESEIDQLRKFIDEMKTFINFSGDEDRMKDPMNVQYHQQAVEQQQTLIRLQEQLIQKQDVLSTLE